VKRMLFASIVAILVASSSVMAQLAVAPEGAVIPNGAYHYVVPGNIPLSAGPLPLDLRFPVAPLYAISYPMVPVPIPPPGGSTSDRIRPQNYNEPPTGTPSAFEGKTSFEPQSVSPNPRGTVGQGDSSVFPHPRTSN
jgi:hypothetical protein